MEESLYYLFCMFFVGQWKREGPGVSCTHMRSIPPIKGIRGHVCYTNHNKHYIIIILRAESAQETVLSLLLFLR